MNDVDESLKLMDFSFRSLKKLTGKDSEKRNARNEERKQDTYSLVMQQVREICLANQSEPISINELHKRIVKRNTSIQVERDELEAIIDYYHKL